MNTNLLSPPKNDEKHRTERIKSHTPDTLYITWNEFRNFSYLLGIITNDFQKIQFQKR